VPVANAQTNIRIGLNLVKEGNAWWLQFSGEETKTRQPFEERFPETLCESLDRYLAVYRPMLAGTRYCGDCLWVGYRFGPQNQHSLQLAIVRATERRFGKSINPHLFRDCAATAIALHDPAAVRIAAAVLGHSTLATAERHYNVGGSRQVLWPRHSDAPCRARRRSVTMRCTKRRCDLNQRGDHAGSDLCQILK
jgi:integrase